MAIIQGIEIRDPSTGTLLDVIETYYDGKWRQQINTPDELTLTVPTATASASIAKYNELWIKRGDTASLARKFVITCLEHRRGLDPCIRITAYDPMVNLMRAAVTGFPADEDLEAGEGEDYYISASLAIERILSTQSEITLGVHPPTSILVRAGDIKMDSGNALEAIQKIRDNIGGLIWVSNTKKLHWYRNRWPAAAGTYKLELDRNTISTVRTVDSVTGVDVVRYDVDVIDLSAHGAADEGMLNVGMPVQVETADGVWTTVYITDITQDLGDPLALEIAVAGADYIGDITDPWPTGTDRDDPLTWSSARGMDINDVIAQRASDACDSLPETIGPETGRAGEDNSYARGGHAHGVDYGTAADVTAIGASTGSEGVVPRIAHADHEHDVNYATAEDIQDAGTASVGVAPRIPHADHSHPIGRSALQDALDELLYKKIERVLALPALATEDDPEIRVFWLDSAQGLIEFEEEGTGDNQEWSNKYPQDRYYPQDKYTTLSGVPVGT